MTRSNQWVMGKGTGNQFAWLEDDEGRNVVCIERLAWLDELDGRTTDEQWQAIIDGIAAAPEMIGLLKAVRNGLAANRTGFGTLAALLPSINAVLAAVEPPRKVKNTVHVTVQVVIETDAGEASEPGSVVLAAVDAVRDGEGDIVHHEIVTERTRGLPGKY